MRKNFNKLLASALLLFSVSVTAQTAYLIKTVAGTGITTPFGPDGIQATASKLNNPTAVAADKFGNIYIADKTNNRIRKVNSAGIITTVAGTGTVGFSGDNGAATLATLFLPSGVAVDNAGNIYIADASNNVVRKVTVSTGIITTIAGQGPPAGPGFGGDGAAATAGTLSSPVAVAVDKYGNIFIVDQNNARIRIVDPSGNINTYAGTTSAGYNMDGIPATTAELNIPSAVCVDTFGNVYIADENNYRIRKVDVGTKMISTFAGTGVSGYTGNGGPVGGAKITYSYGVAADRFGNVFISDNQEVRKISATDSIFLYAGAYGISTFIADGGLADTSKLNNPQGLAVDTAGNLYIADEANNRIRKVYKVTLVSGVQQISGQNSNLNVFPNPNNGTFTIKGSLNSTNDDNLMVSVMNVSGQVVYKSNIVVHNGVINTLVALERSLPEGYYLLNIQSATQNEIAKFIIQK